MVVRYKTDFCESYMLMEIPEETEHQKYSFKMLQRNKIAGVLSCKERREDGIAYLYLDISGKKNFLQEYKEKEMELEDIILFFQQLIPILEELKKYLLSERMVVLEPEYIFRDMEDGKLYLTVLPWEREEEHNLHKLAEFFLEKINHKDEFGVNSAYQFYRQQNQQNFSLYHFISVLEKENILKRQKNREKTEIGWIKPITDEAEPYLLLDESGEISEKLVEKDDQKEGKGKEYFAILFAVFAIGLLLFGHFSMIKKLQKMICLMLSILSFSIAVGIKFILLCSNKKRENLKTENKEREEKEIVLESGLEDTVFYESDASEEILKLQWKEKGRTKQAALRDFPCTVGKIKGEVSIVIEHSSVSRVHCRFIEKDAGIAIMDLNSTNGTYLNGMRLKEGEMIEIVKNDEILIGKVKVLVV